jgi:hypothetical protein
VGHVRACKAPSLVSNTLTPGVLSAGPDMGSTAPLDQGVTTRGQGAPVPARGVFCDVNQRILRQHTGCVSCRLQAQNTLSHGAPHWGVTGCTWGVSPSQNTLFSGVSDTPGNVS